MSKPLFRAPRGMHDALPQDSWRWRKLESLLAELAACYQYQEIRLPLLESTALFQRSLGDHTDIVEKEMYCLHSGSEKLSLRPEATAGCVRAALQHDLMRSTPQRLWYCGPMFRRERPQQGRFRQFHQFGAEIYGGADSDIEGELLCMQARLWQWLEMQDSVQLVLNSLGDSASRQRYLKQLVAYLESNQDSLGDDDRRRLQQNPLRLLDSKNPHTQKLLQQGPMLSEYRDSQSQKQLDSLCRLLQQQGIPYRLNPFLVRGIDYYNGTVFEWTSDALGAQAAVSAGGRYDGLIAQCGGRPGYAAGFAIGLERLLTLWCAASTPPASDAYLAIEAGLDHNIALGLAESLRDALPMLKLQTDCSHGSLKSQLRRADRSGARWALILAGEELASDKIAIKYLRQERPQEQIACAKLATHLKELLFSH